MRAFWRYFWRYVRRMAAAFYLVLALVMLLAGVSWHSGHGRLPVADPRCPSRYSQSGVCTNALTPGYTPSPPGAQEQFGPRQHSLLK